MFFFIKKKTTYRVQMLYLIGKTVVYQPTSLCFVFTTFRYFRCAPCTGTYSFELTWLIGTQTHDSYIYHSVAADGDRGQQTRKSLRGAALLHHHWSSVGRKSWIISEWLESKPCPLQLSWSFFSPPARHPLGYSSSGRYYKSKQRVIWTVALKLPGC